VNASANELKEKILTGLAAAQVYDGHVKLGKSGKDFKGLCPFHPEGTPSFTVFSDNLHFHCYGCGKHGSAFDFVMAMDGVDFREAITRLAAMAGVSLNGAGSTAGNGNHSRSKHRITVEELAKDKKLPPEFLRSLGLKDTAGGVDIPYHLPGGSLAPRHQIRYGLKANGGSCWDDNEGPVVAYGLDRLAEAREAGFLCLVEGTSDCWTLWHHKFPALGIPGASMTSKLEASHVAGISKLYIIREPDDGGASFVHGFAGRLAEIGWKGPAFVVSFYPFKDPNELHQSNPETFREKFQKALSAADPLDAAATTGAFRLTVMQDLLAEPEEHVAYVLDGKLPAGGLGLLSAKPKVGKSTFARGLCLAVARGEPFLDCATTQGPVIYLALEEKRSEVRRHFADLGATGEEPIYVHVASAPRDAVPELCALVKKMKPVLLAIDPLFKLIRVKDEKGYAEVCLAIEPLLVLARESGTHVLATHHNTKADPVDAMDAILGSTAIFGGVDSAIILKKSDRYRTIQSSQRYGTDWPELVLNFDTVERSLSLGAEKSQAETERVGEAIATYLAGCDEPQTREQVEEHVEGKTAKVRGALKALCDAGRVSRSGSGTRGNPFYYGLESSRKTSPEPIPVSCSQVYTGTREQESQNGAEPRINTGDILVPDFPPEAKRPEQLFPTPEQAFPGTPERFGQPHAHLFLLIGKQVWTPRGTGRLETAYATRCEVELDSSPGQLSVFQPEEIRIKALERATDMAAALGAGEQEGNR
jgi:hypothetical protein